MADHPILAALDDHIATQGVDTAADAWRTRVPAPPTLTLEPGTALTWVLATNKGTVEIELLGDEAPAHVVSTLYLTRLGFYDGLSFHRVIDGFMAQGGCPLGTGTGGPGYTYDGEFGGSARHDRRGILSMANAGPGTDGSQFFLTFVATPHLDGNHTVFGRVTGGAETLDALEAAGSRSGRTSEPLRIDTATIRVG